jgi:hypothetical protein
VADHGDPPDLAAAAERLRSWLDDLIGTEVEGLAAWHQAHGGHLIAAALSLEAMAQARIEP